MSVTGTCPRCGEEAEVFEKNSVRCDECGLHGSVVIEWDIFEADETKPNSNQS